MTRQGDILGYARVSTADQDLSGDVACLEDSGAVCMFTDVVSGKTFNRSGLIALMKKRALATRLLSSVSTH